MCSTSNLIPHKHSARCRTGTRDPALSPPWSCAALSISAACEVLQRSSDPCSSPSRSSVRRWTPRPHAVPPPARIAQRHRLRCPDPCRATQSTPSTARHPPLLPCAAPTHAGSAPAALRSARHPCGLPSTQHCASLTCTRILPHHGIACCLHPLSRGKTPQDRFWGSGPGHPLQHSLPAGNIPAHAVWGIDQSLPCPLRIRSKIAYTLLWVIPRSCLPRLGPLPCGLAFGTCTAEIGALQRLSLDLQTDPSIFYVCGKTHVRQTLSAPYLLFHYHRIATFSCYREILMIYNKKNNEIVLLYGC